MTSSDTQGKELPVYRRQFGIAVALLVVVAVAGCMSGDAKLVPVTGKVTYKGQPVANANVTFVHAGGKTSPVGVTDASGVFTLGSPTGQGAIVGDYKVGIVKKAAREGAPANPKPEDMIKMMQGGKSVPEPKDEIPVKYADATTSGLTAKVTGDKEKDNFTFELTD
jgi:hypothetical protein